MQERKVIFCYAERIYWMAHLTWKQACNCLQFCLLKHDIISVLCFFTCYSAKERFSEESKYLKIFNNDCINCIYLSCMDTSKAYWRNSVCTLRPWDLVRSQLLLGVLQTVCRYTYQINFEVLSPGSDKAFLYYWYMSWVVEEITERVPQPMVYIWKDKRVSLCLRDENKVRLSTENSNEKLFKKVKSDDCSLPRPGTSELRTCLEYKELNAL